MVSRREAKELSALMNGRVRRFVETKRRLSAGIVAGVVASVMVSAFGFSLASARDVPPCEQITIKSGDTLSLIARTYGLTTPILMEWNPEIVDPNLIVTGRQLCITRPVHIQANFVRERAVECVGQAQPGAVAFRDAVRHVWPGLGDLGIYNCRTARGSSSHSTHAEGRAVDFAIPACSTGEGQAIAHELAMRSAALGISRILVCDAEWVVGQGWSTPSDYLQSLHDGRRAPAHIHAELTRQAADELTTEYILRSFAPEEAVAQ